MPPRRPEVLPIRLDPVRGRDFNAPMRILVLACLLGALALAGCAGHKPAPESAGSWPTEPGSSPKLIVTPETTLVGRVAKVNTDDRFVVLSFAPGHLPKLDQHLNLYRHGLKAGEVKVTGPQADEIVVADLLNGDAEVGDEVRDK